MAILGRGACVALFLVYGYRGAEWNISCMFIMANKMERKNKTMRYMTIFKQSLQFRQARNMVLFK